MIGESKPNVSMDALAARVERLERQNRWLSRALMMVAAGAALLLTLAAVSPPSIQEVVKAQRFEVVDNAGNVRAELAVSPDGSPGLMLHDPDGKLRALLAVSPDGYAGMRLFGAADANSFAGITVSPHGTGLGMAFLDAAGKQRVGLSILGDAPDQSPFLKLYDADGETVFSAP